MTFEDEMEGLDGPDIAHPHWQALTEAVMNPVFLFCLFWFGEREREGREEREERERGRRGRRERRGEKRRERKGHF